MARTYNQDCILAHALDLLGERWTLLIIRDLFLGPQRFGDLQAALPGIGANLLSKRLKELEEAGLIEAVSTGDARGRYRLTDTGEALRPSIRTMMKWSIMYFFERPESCPARECIYTDNLQPDSVALAIEIFAAYCPEPENNYVAHILIDDFPYTIYNMNGQMTVRRGGDGPAVATIISDVATIMQSFRMELTTEEAKSRMKMSGDQKALAHLLRCIVHKEVHDSENTVTPLAASF
ncbi:winged helix-turn-helix transcriptional regulator [Marinicaulis aureus]|uniref:Winged helix-turn-helix transcriptional regulator n=1 Tax=Hyphococcus aureus TaxID=2666033 RepID=A0ABW1KVB0_9PROT